MDVKEKGMQKKVYIAIAAVAAAAILALVLILALGGKEEAYRSIKIIELEGGVTIEREGVGVLAASSNMNLVSGDAVKTGQNAYAVLQLDSDKYVMLAESGSMTVVAEGDEANGRTAIQLDCGSVLNEIQNPLSNSSSYDIVTPNATMSVRGTVFEVRKNEDGNSGNIEVLVYDGKVAVGLDGMEPALYEAGEYTQFTAGENPQFIIERTEITEEYLNTQFMERLEQIHSQNRELNLGTVQLASAQTQGQSPEPTEKPEQTPEASRPTEEPEQTAAPVQTEQPAVSMPSAAPAATPKPVKTPVPQTGVQAPGVAAPAETPAAGNAQPDENDDDDEEDIQPEEPQPTQEPEEPQPTQSPEEPQPTQSPEEPQPTQSPEEPQPTQSPEEPQPTQSPEEPQPTQEPEEPQPTQSPEEPQPTQSPEEPQPTQSPEEPQPTQEPEEPQPTQSPEEPQPTQEPEEPQPTQEPEEPQPTQSPEEPQPTQKPDINCQDLWKTYTITDYLQKVADYDQNVSSGGAAEEECTVVFYLPYIVKADGDVANMRNDAPAVYSSMQVQAGSLLLAPEKEPEGRVDYSGQSLHFQGWCLESGEDWEFGVDIVKADTCLYPVWRDDDDNYYYPVICRSATHWGYYHYCNSVKEGSSLGGITLPGGWEVDFKGWIRLNHPNEKWTVSSVVEGAESLKAFWGK